MASAKSPWITQLQFAFHDENFLFLVMEYVAGGSLLNLLFKLDVFDEVQTKFYIAEIVYAIEEIHQMGYCHRLDHFYYPPLLSESPTEICQISVLLLRPTLVER